MYPECYGQNPLFPDSRDFQVVMFDHRQGLGVKALRSFRPGELIAEFTGEYIHERTQHSLQIDSDLHIDDLYFAGYFLHSCAPNVRLDMRRRRVYSAESIEPHDFLRMDYAQTEDILFKQFPCSCGAPQCRSWITGHQEEPDFTNSLYRELILRKDHVA